MGLLEKARRVDYTRIVPKKNASKKVQSARMLDFKVILEPAPEGGYVVTCPSLPGCYSQGEDAHEALANIREAIELCLEDMAEHGEPVPDPSETLVGSVLVER